MKQAAANCGEAGGYPCEHVLPDPLSILLVGEGNLSFTNALVRRLSHSAAFRRATQTAGPGVSGSVVEVTATTFDDEAELTVKYPESTAFRAYFAAKQRIPVRYLGSVNATALVSSLSTHAATEDSAFNLVVFNNPHIGFEDLYRQRSLLSHFFASAAELYRQGPALPQPQEIVVALCDDQAQRWDLLGCAARSGYMCVAAQPLLPSEYPEYTNRRHQSDSAFPFQRMVQYWFVRPTPALKTTLWELRDEMSLWEKNRAVRTTQKQLSGFSCSAWLSVADALLPPLLSNAEADGMRSPVIEAASCVAECGSLGLSLNYVACDSVVPIPLLHPKVVAQVLQQLLCPTSARASPSSSDCFTPYLPSRTWATLYRAQRWAEEHSCSAVFSGEEGENPNKSEAVPPHLDTVVLGRPLTVKEAKKLERYLSGYGAAMKTKALKKKGEVALAQVAWSCATCTPPRTFDTEQDLQQHRASKHSGAVQLPPTLYARVHEQIQLPTAQPPTTALENDFAAMSLHSSADGCYCAVCGLQYKTPEAFEEHLRYLSPLPGDLAAALTCDLCQPPKQFTDRRGLEQHRISKHASVAA